MGVMENTYSMTKVFFITDSINSRFPIPHSKNNAYINNWKSTFVFILPPTVEDEISLFVLSDVENYDDCFETLARPALQ